MRSIHIVGLDVQIGYTRRQLCAWCGYQLHEDDLSRMAWPLNSDGSDPGPPGMWPVGSLMVVDNGVRYIMNLEEGEGLPADCCASLTDEIELNLNQNGEN